SASPDLDRTRSAVQSSNINNSPRQPLRRKWKGFSVKSKSPESFLPFPQLCEPGCISRRQDHRNRFSNGPRDVGDNLLGTDLVAALRLQILFFGHFFVLESAFGKLGKL
ncbi:hypothetical protein CLAIMM_14533 isoform 1, partial [Cladophialophora immunda]